MVNWYVSTKVFAGRTIYDINKAIRESGHFSFEADYNPDDMTYAECPFDPSKGPIVAYGPIKFIRKNCLGKGFIPGAFGFKDCTAIDYMSNYPLEWFLNRDCVIISWGMLKRLSIRDAFNRFGDGKGIFLRPVSGYKTFTGFVVEAKNFAFELNTLPQISPLYPEDLIMIGPEKQIDAEFRYVIVDGKVISGSEYRWDNILDIRRDTLPICDELAKKVAEYPYQLDTVYVVDICWNRDKDEAKIVEFNSFASAGLYACDLEKVVRAVSESAEREWNETF